MRDITVEIVASGTVGTRLSPAPGGGKRLVTARAGDSVADLLDVLGLSDEPLLVILGERVIVPDARGTTLPDDGDRLVIAPPIRAG